MSSTETIKTIPHTSLPHQREVGNGVKVFGGIPKKDTISPEKSISYSSVSSSLSKHFSVSGSP